MRCNLLLRRTLLHVLQHHRLRARHQPFEAKTVAANAYWVCASASFLSVFIALRVLRAIPCLSCQPILHVVLFIQEKDIP